MKYLRTNKYYGLSDYLKHQNKKIITLSFNNIEDIIGADLPPSAFKHHAWWSNDKITHSQARSWIYVGWRTFNIDLYRKLVTFKKFYKWLNSPHCRLPFRNFKNMKKTKFKNLLFN